MSSARSWPAAELLTSTRLLLEPLRPDHADQAAVMLSDTDLYAFIGGNPPPASALRTQYERQVAGQSPGGDQGWLNWMARCRETGDLAGTVQATLFVPASFMPASSEANAAQLTAELAWIVATNYQGQGLATEAARTVMAWLARRGVVQFQAHVHPRHTASQRVAQGLGLRPTSVMVDGETQWTC
jgi:RimJ/RimL family protein N-acetyltransferase